MLTIVHIWTNMLKVVLICTNPFIGNYYEHFLEIFAYFHRYFHWLGWFSFDGKYLLINRRGARALTSESIHSRIFFLMVGDAFPRRFFRRCLSKAFFSWFFFSQYFSVLERLTKTIGQ